MFTITCESTVDLSIEYLHKRNCDAICYSYFLGTEERVDHMQRRKRWNNFTKILKNSSPPHRK